MTAAESPDLPYSDPAASRASSPIRVVFFGTPPFAAIQLRGLLAMNNVTVVGVITQPDRPAGRGQKLVPSAVKELATAQSIPVLQPVSLRKEGEAVDQFARQTGPWDIGVVAAYGLIVPQSILDLPARGCVNVHGSLLPRWRGAAPIQRAILAGDTESGVCLMRMEAGLDTGPVFVREPTPISAIETTGSLHDRLAVIGAELLQKYLGAIVANTLPAIPQPEVGVTYAEKISKEEAQIDWTHPADTIARVIRAFNPTPGAFFTLEGERMKVWAAKRDETATAHRLAPGQIHISAERLVIGCGSGTAIEILELQPAGKKRLLIAEYLRGIDHASFPSTANLVK